MRLPYLIGIPAFVVSAFPVGAAPAAVAMTARAGDTVAISLGPQEALSRRDLTVTITPATGGTLTYDASDPILRAVVTLFPDPVSRVAVEAARRPAGDGDGPAAATDGSQTVVYLALPDTLPIGVATVRITGPEGRTFAPVAVDVLPAAAPTGQGSRGGGAVEALAAFERTEHHTISFAGPSAFHSAQVALAYEAGAERPVVVNPRPAVKNVAWFDDGSVLRVLLTPTDGRTPVTVDDFTFYVAGTVGELRVIGVSAYDVSGARIGAVEVHVR